MGMKVSQAAMMIADNASRIGDDSVLLDRPITETDITDLLLGADLQTGKKLDLYRFGRVIVSSLETDPDDPTGEPQGAAHTFVAHHLARVEQQHLGGLDEGDGEAVLGQHRRPLAACEGPGVDADRFAQVDVDLLLLLGCDVVQCGLLHGMWVGMACGSVRARDTGATSPSRSRTQAGS